MLNLLHFSGFCSYFCIYALIKWYTSARNKRSLQPKSDYTIEYWTKIPGIHYTGISDVEYLTPDECMQMCLQTDYCRAIDYTYYRDTGQCVLSNIVRDKAPDLFVSNTQSTYYELLLYKGMFLLRVT